jgi:protein-tyrosine phosphatase
VLVVCTGNICRSPAAAHLLAARMTSARVEVESAGTGALVGEPVDPPMAALLRAAGVDADGFAARDLRREHLRRADLVLVMTRAHRAAVVTMLPSAVRRTFLLVEAAEIAGRIAADGWPDRVVPEPAARLAVLPALAAPYRGAVASVAREVTDPYRGRSELYEQTFSDIEAAVARLAAAVGATTGGRQGWPTGDAPPRGGDAA